MPGDHREEMLVRIGRMLDAQADRGGHAARQRIDRLLDRDSPFLELAAHARGDTVVGIGVVEAAACLVVSADHLAADPDEPKVRRAVDRARACGLPVVVLDDTGGEPEPVSRHRQQLRWRAPGRPRPPAPPAPPPEVDPDGLLDVPAPREILRHVVDGSQIDELRAGGTGVTGWATVGGLPVGVVAGPDPGADPPDLAGRPLLRISVTSVPGSAPEVGVHVGIGSADPASPAFRFSWPGPELPRTPDHDGVIDPRDTRVVVGIARWCLEPG